ncbi:MAG: hypothetical protein EZS28_007201 [Streblomastix strix]|uniref:RRM domain-containing protein n=1 Tax=Streblomastix strix TaxID=222440 RepID=A0A5J4WQR7_9EUKA|nr:MAG: hypothetical protein EZS28_007201 [Streblomastix strix]
MNYARGHTAAQVTNPAELYVGGLSYTTTNGKLYKFFTEALRVINVQIIRNPNGNCKGYGFVEMRDVKTAQCAINVTNGLYLNGRKIRVGFSRSFSHPRFQSPGMYYVQIPNYPDQLHVGGLNQSVTEEELYQLFNDALRVVKAKVICTNGVCRGFGFVTMVDATSAQNVMHALNGSYLDGRKITVSHARPEAPRTRPPPLSRTRHQFADQTSNARSISVQPQIQQSSNSQQQHQQIFSSNFLRENVSYTHPANIQESSSSSQIPLNAQNPQSLKCLKVSNFDISMTQEQLRQLFTKTGEVDDVKIVIEAGNRVGYVKMKYGEDALKAVDDLDGIVIKERCIGVILATPDGNAPRIKLSNLPPNITEDELREQFYAYEPRFIVLPNEQSGQPAGIGFIEFYSNRDKQRAIHGIPNFTLRGRIISVRAANYA